MKMYFSRYNAKMPNNILLKKYNILFSLKNIFFQNNLFKIKTPPYKWIKIRNLAV